MGFGAKPARVTRRAARATVMANARRNWCEWWATPLAARLYVALAAATALTFTARSLPVLATARGAPLILALLVAGSSTNIELGRWLEGGGLDRDRTHKGLSVWPFMAALLMPAGAGGWVALVAYSHMRGRGIRIALWKWVLSWSAVTLSSIAAAGLFRVWSGGRLPPVGSGRVVLAIALAVAGFVVTEALVFLGISRLNRARDEVHLRRALASPDFYLTEFVLLAGAASAAVLMRYSPWALLLTFPGYVQLQRAVIYRSLREEARRDGKTGLLNSETWRMESIRAHEHARRRRRSVAVLLADLDHFKQVNDTYGHMVGDEVLVATASALAGLVRQHDLVGRFGGEEFCILLQDVDRAQALAIGERVLQQIESLTFSVPELRTTISVGVSIADPGDPVSTISELVSRADDKLYEAKLSGRNRIR
jgi:diguanylate cyclase (GGDEF)-like protein